MKVVKSLTPGLENEFCYLRGNVLGWALYDVQLRLIDGDIHLNEEDEQLETLVELIEGQVREAVKELNRKGYCTTDSGFWGERGEYQKQFIEGLFNLDAKTTQILENLGIYVENGKRWSSMWFYAENPDFEEIKNTWNEIAALIPDLGHRARSQDEILAPVDARVLAKILEAEKSGKKLELLKK